MNVFEKLNEARLRFQNAGVSKSGHNKFAGYTYYELADILPEINKLANELKFCCIVNFTSETATLDFVDLEGDGKITFTSPMAETKSSVAVSLVKFTIQQNFNSFANLFISGRMSASS